MLLVYEEKDIFLVDQSKPFPMVQSKPFSVDHRKGIYLVLTAEDVTMEEFYRAVCGFHYFTFPSKVGYTLPYAWVGNSGKQCPEVCAYPFVVLGYMGGGGLGKLSPQDDVGVNGMVSVIGHELAELSSNLLVNAWYADEDPTTPTETRDLCEGLYGTFARIWEIEDLVCSSLQESGNRSHIW